MSIEEAFVLPPLVVEALDLLPGRLWGLEGAGRLCPVAPVLEGFLGAVVPFRPAPGACAADVVVRDGLLDAPAAALDSLGDGELGLQVVRKAARPAVFVYNVHGILLLFPEQKHYKAGCLFSRRRREPPRGLRERDCYPIPFCFTSPDIEQKKESKAMLKETETKKEKEP